MTLDSNVEEEELINAIQADDVHKVRSLLSVTAAEDTSRESRKRLEMRHKGGRTPL